jgi:signal transduction histidine kinase
VEIAPPSEDTLIALSRAVTTAKLHAGAIHEVNNVLLVVSGTAELLQARGTLPPDIMEALERLRTHSNRGASAMAEVLQFVRAPRDERSPVNLREIAAHALALRQFAMKRARITARLDLDRTSFVVIGNRADLEQALLNLLINAEDALAGRTGTIVVTLGTEPGHVTMRVEDDGPGMALDPPERAFTAFVSGKASDDSAGLGLWAARIIAERHGGTLTLEGPSTGTSVVMRLPAAPARTEGRSAGT